MVGGEKASNASTGGLSHKEVRLPKLELPIFDGEVVQWPAFWDQFEAMVDNSEIPDVSKFVYLRSLLKGEALSAIIGLTLSSQHYIIAKDILRYHFGRKERIIFALIQQLMQLRVNQTQSSKTIHLMRLQDELVTHVRSLEVLGVNGDQYGVILTPLILSLLHQDVRLERARGGEGHESDLDWLLKFLSAEIQRRERSHAFKDPTPAVSTTEARMTRMSSAAALQSSSSTGDGRVTCEACDAKGHVLLCNPRPSEVESRLTSSAVENDKIVAQAVSPSNVYHATVASAVQSRKQAAHASVILQTAYVEATGHTRKKCKVTVLFDTGSDRSYISSKLVKQIDPEWAGAQHVAYSAFGSSAVGVAASYETCFILS